jgi:molybdate transport system substrate-binding protein
LPSDFREGTLKTLCVIIILVACAVLFPGCRSTADSSKNELTLSAAVSLKDAFIEIGQINEQRTGIKTHFNFGASGALQKQIESGAPVDMFASAGAKQMDDLATRSLILPETRTDFARNDLVLVAPTSGPAISSFTDLTRPGIKKIATGNPKTVPAGQYTEQTFGKLKLLPIIQSKLIYAEDARQVLDYVVRGEVDAGIVYSSDALSAGNTVKIVAHAPGDSHDPIVYPIAIIKDSQRQEAAHKFLDLVLSSEGQSILVKHGFLSIK